MRRIVGIVCLGLVLLATSCQKAIERAQRDIRLEAVESIERKGMSGAAATIRVANDSRYKLVLKNARFELFYGEVPVSSFTLHGRVEIPRRTSGSYRSLWRVVTEDPMIYYMVTKKIEAGEIDRIAVSFTLEGRGGPASAKMSEEMMPFSEFLNIFGLDLDEVRKYLDE